jgi:hypothetical protein
MQYPVVNVQDASSVVHETLVVDCQIHHSPLDLAIQREQIVIY